jgi:hypothetical protein
MLNLTKVINIVVFAICLMFILLYVIHFINTGEFNNGIIATIGLSIYSYINVKATR